MRKLKTHITLLLTLLFMSLFVGSAVHAQDIALPASDWYAVIWNRGEDALHFANSVGVQASITRPKLPDENTDFSANLHISPDGRMLLIQGTYDNGNDGIGFYDLETASFIQTHEAQAGEFNVVTQHNPFSFNGSEVAVALADGTNWRVIAFETETGNAIAQLTSAEVANVPEGWVPQIMLYDVDEGLGQTRVHVRFIPQGPINGVLDAPSIAWIPALGQISATNTIPSNARDLDFMQPGGQMLYTVSTAESFATDANLLRAVAGNFEAPSTIYDDAEALAYSPRWLYNGQFVGFRVAQQPFATMWHLMPANGGESIPFAPDYDYMYGTVDGFIISDIDTGVARYSNTFQFEAFTPAVGNVIYETENTPFQFIYVTPMHAQFTLPSVRTNDDGLVGGGDVILNPEIPCEGAPPQRVYNGDTARVTFTDGTALNVRQTPGGNLVTQLPEGTVFEIVADPQCLDGYRWFSIETNNVAGWVAEGSQEDYFIEPIDQMQVGDITIQPTATQLTVQVVPTATPLPPRAPVVDGDCSMAIEQEIEVGMSSIYTIQGDGQLSMRDHPTDEFPTELIPSGLRVEVIGGPLCHQGFRNWRIRVTVNNQQIEGWVSEGLPGRRYLGKPPRAS